MLNVRLYMCDRYHICETIPCVMGIIYVRLYMCHRYHICEAIHVL